jgi:hypothetical protein
MLGLIMRSHMPCTTRFGRTFDLPVASVARRAVVAPTVQGKLTEGLDWLQSKSHLWTDLCSFMVTHNHFHIVLNYLDMGACVHWQLLAVRKCASGAHPAGYPSFAGDFSKCLQHYDKCVWGVDKTNMQDEMGALGLLLKLHLRMAIHDVTASVTKAPTEPKESVVVRLIDKGALSVVVVLTIHFSCHGVSIACCPSEISLSRDTRAPPRRHDLLPEEVGIPRRSFLRLFGVLP